MARRRRRDGVDSPLFSNSSQRILNNTAHTSRHMEARMYQRILAELAINRFVWKGLPPGMTSRFLELTLLKEPLCVFYYDRDYDRFLSLRSTSVGPINIYDNPTEFRVMGNGTFTSKTLNAQECVPIWCNYLRIPDIDIVMVFADKLAQVSRTIDINLIQQRKPFMVAAPENKRIEAVNVMRQLQDGEFAILGNENLDLNSMIQAFNTQIHPDLVTNTQLAKQKIWNECMTLLGINNANQDKRERLVVDEVAANDEQIEAARSVALSARQEAVDAINERWGLSVSVEFNGAPSSSLIGPDFAPKEPNDSGSNSGDGVDI